MYQWSTGVLKESSKGEHGNYKIANVTSMPGKLDELL